jgi:hypothetical protein
VGTYKKEHADAKRKEDTYPVCLRGDLNADWQNANRELERAQKEAQFSDAKEGTVRDDLAERVRAIEQQMLEHTETWRLRAMPRHKFRALVAAHPPRLGEDGEPVDEDKRLGINRETFTPALISASVVEPVLDDEDWAWLFGDENDDDSGVLNDRQIGDLEDMAWFLNRDQVAVPFSVAASLATRDTASE